MNGSMGMHMCACLDKCVEALDLRDTAFSGEGLRTLVTLLQNNDTLTWLRFQK